LEYELHILLKENRERGPTRRCVGELANKGKGLLYAGAYQH